MLWPSGKHTWLSPRRPWFKSWQWQFLLTKNSFSVCVSPQSLSQNHATFTFLLPWMILVPIGVCKISNFVLSRMWQEIRKKLSLRTDSQFFLAALPTGNKEAESKESEHLLLMTLQPWKFVMKKSFFPDILTTMLSKRALKIFG